MTCAEEVAAEVAQEAFGKGDANGKPPAEGEVVTEGAVLLTGAAGADPSRILSHTAAASHPLSSCKVAWELHWHTHVHHMQAHHNSAHVLGTAPRPSLGARFWGP